MSDRGGIRALAEREPLSEIFHQLSQPLSVLECGLELSLDHDRTTAEFRRRLKVLLKAAQELHRRLARLRVLESGEEPIERAETTSRRATTSGRGANPPAHR